MVPVEVTLEVMVEVGVVCSHVAKVPSANDSKASFSVPMTSGQSGIRKYPPAAQVAVASSSPREYSKIMTFSAALVSVQDSRLSATALYRPSTGALQVTIPAPELHWLRRSLSSPV